MKKIVKDIQEFEKIPKDFLEKIICARQDLAQATIVGLFICARQDLAQATIVGLFGDLGAGKTTFVQNIAKNLGIKSKVNSPTFVLMKRYPIKLSGRRTSVWKNIYHIDAYRLEGKDIIKELEILGWKEIVSNPENLVFIEWPEIIKKYIPKKVIKIKIKHLKNKGRQVNIIFPKS